MYYFNFEIPCDSRLSTATMLLDALHIQQNTTSIYVPLMETILHQSTRDALCQICWGVSCKSLLLQNSCPTVSTWKIHEAFGEGLLHLDLHVHFCIQLDIKNAATSTTYGQRIRSLDIHREGGFCGERPTGDEWSGTGVGIWTGQLE